jgi:hypothetical protein
VLGTSGTTVLFGDSSANTGVRSGGRIEAGTWIGPGEIFGVEASFLMLSTKAANLSASSNGSTILARPFIDANTGQPSAVRVVYPGELSGSIDCDVLTTGLVGAGFLFRGNLLCGGCSRLDLLVGYRYLRFRDQLGVSEDSTAPAGNPELLTPGTRITAADEFGAKNVFRGFDCGLAADFRRGGLLLSLIGKLAVGFNQQDVDIFGTTTVTVPGSAPLTSQGGPLALANNTGHFSRGGEVSVIPEFDAKLGYQVSPHLRATIGYTIVYWDNVVRATDQFDRSVNPNLLPNSQGTGGPGNPAFAYHRDNIWIQGLNPGLEFRF